MRVFVDTNIFVSQFDHREPAKRLRAWKVMDEGEHEVIVSTQVLLEFFNVLTRRFRDQVSTEQAKLAISGLLRLQVVGSDTDLVLRAIDTATRYQLSIWDAMVVEAAAQAGCEELWTEDLNTGATLRGVRIVNPLLDT